MKFDLNKKPPKRYRHHICRSRDAMTSPGRKQTCSLSNRYTNSKRNNFAYFTVTKWLINVLCHNTQLTHLLKHRRKCSWRFRRTPRTEFSKVLVGFVIWCLGSHVQLLALQRFLLFGLVIYSMKKYYFYLAVPSANPAVF